MTDLTHLLRALLPRNMADDLVAEGGTEFIGDMVRRYLEADEDSRADMRAFHDSDGPDKVRDAHERLRWWG